MRLKFWSENYSYNLCGFAVEHTCVIFSGEDKFLLASHAPQQLEKGKHFPRVKVYLLNI